MDLGSIRSFNESNFTKAGDSPVRVHTVCIDGWGYEAGYNKPAGRGIGEVVSFNSEVKYGKQSRTGDLVRVGSGGAATPVAAPSPSEAPRASYGAAMPKEFPIPALHPDRSIIRQNSLAHATKLYCDGGNLKPDFNSMEDMKKAAEDIIELAYLFEEYATGDREKNAAKDKASE